jgi:hypothetical protein
MIQPQGDSLYAWSADGAWTHEHAVPVRGRDIFAGIALYSVIALDDEPAAQSGIVQVVTDRGVQGFPRAVPLGSWRRARSITFAVHVGGCWAGARWMLDFWP